jgi:hypothetical protein
MINIFTKSKKATGMVMIDKTLLYRDSVIMICHFCARRRPEFSARSCYRNHGKHGRIERNFTNVITEVFPRTCHERGLRSRLRRAFYERGTFVVYVRDYGKTFTFVVRSWFTFVITEKSSIVGLRMWMTFVITCTAELNESYGLRSPFNLHERGLGTEHGTNVELAVITARNQDTALFYHSFYGLMVDGWMFFRISPWGSLMEKTYVITNVRFEREIRFTYAVVITIRSFPFSLSIGGTILQMHYVITNVR